MGTFQETFLEYQIWYSAKAMPIDENVLSTQLLRKPSDHQRSPLRYVIEISA